MEEEKKERKKLEGKKEINNGLINDRITLFEQQQQDYYYPKRVSDFWNINIVNMKVMVIKIDIYH